MLQRAPTVVRSDVAEISLGNGRVAIIDSVDLPLVSECAWRAQKGKSGTYYAAANGGKLLHRVLLGSPKGLLVDHENGDGLDNRRSNLRVCNNAENTRNQRKRLGVTSKFKGVTSRHGQWVAAIQKNGRKVHLGSYTSEELAAKQYDRAARLMFGRFAKTNEMLGLLQ